MEAGLLEARDVLPLDEEQIGEIVDAMELLSTCQQRALKPVFDALDQNYDYGILRCVMAELCG